MANKSLVLFFVVAACIGLSLESSYQRSVGRDLPLSVLTIPGETRLVCPLSPNDSSPAGRTASLFFSQTNPLVLDHVEALMLCLSARRALERFRVILLPGFPLEILKPPIFSF